MKKSLSLIVVFSLLITLFAVTPSFAEEAYKNDGWEITTSSEMNSTSAGINNAFDGNYNSMWHSKYTAEGSTITSKDVPPYVIEVKFKSALEISAIRYVPRQAASGNSSAGNWEQADFYGSADGTT